MRKVLQTITCLYLCLGLVACAITENSEPGKQLGATRIPLSPATMTLQPEITTIPVVVPTPTPSPVATLMLQPTGTDIQEPLEVSQSLGARLIAVLQPPLNPRGQSPENLWWSEDGSLLYFQEVQTRRAWVYDVTTGISTTIPYVPRSFHELAPTIEATLPDNAQLMSISPSREYALYLIRLPEPIPFSGSPVPTKTEYPPYHYELWLRHGDEDVRLGLVDSSFGLLGPPIWSANENVAVVNTAGAPGVKNIYDSWLIDIDALSVGRLDTPWEGIVYFYSVRDLSPDGDLLLVRADINYFYDRTTGEQAPIPNTDTDRIILISKDDKPGCLISELEHSETILRDNIWYCEPETGRVSVIAIIPGNTSQYVISPDNRFIAFAVTNQFPTGIEYEDIPEGVWLVPLPQ